LYLDNPRKYNRIVAGKGFYKDWANSNKRRHNRLYISTHHIVPRSRCGEPDYLDYMDNDNNTTSIARNLHDYYHWIFINLTLP